LNLPSQILISDLLRHRVRCDQGLDHGIGFIPWMFPPVHRILGWVSKPSIFQLTRDVWRLDQLRGIGDQEVYVKGKPSTTDQLTVDRIPTLFQAELFGNNGNKLGKIADFSFEPKTGTILHYLISRTDPRIPGTSRWRLSLDLINDQQPGMVETNLLTLDELPLSKASLRQDLLKKSRKIREQINDLSDTASNRLEGWLEDPPWESEQPRKDYDSNYDPLENWNDNITKNNNKTIDSYDSENYDHQGNLIDSDDHDPWI